MGKKILNLRKISNLPEEFKVVDIKMLTELGRRVNIVRASTKREHKEISSRSHRAKEYNN